MSSFRQSIHKFCAHVRSSPHSSIPSRNHTLRSSPSFRPSSLLNQHRPVHSAPLPRTSFRSAVTPSRGPSQLRFTATMSLPRRSHRIAMPTPRSQEYRRTLNSRKSSTPGSAEPRPFPSTDDYILVKWLVGDSDIWWRARVLDIDHDPSVVHSCRGRLLYDPLGKYTEESAEVRFSFDPVSSSHIVTTVHEETSETEESSWKFDTESVESHTKVHSCAVITGHASTSKPKNLQGVADDRTSHGKLHFDSRSLDTVPHDHTAAITNTESNTNPASSALKQSSKRTLVCRADRPVRKVQKGHHSTRSVPRALLASTSQLSLHNGSAVRATSTATSSTRSAHDPPVVEEEEEITTSSPGNEAVKQLEPQVQCQKEASDRGSQLNPLQLGANATSTSVSLRIEQLEETVKLLLARTNPQPTLSDMSTTVQSVLQNLKWSLFKRFEKPLRVQAVPLLSVHGVASTVLSVKCDCDFHAFKSITRILAHRYSPSATIPTDSQATRLSRIAFHPNYSRTQSSSAGVDKLSVSFTCLSDIMDSLNVRDEDDYERILSTEVDSSRGKVLQIVGTLEVKPSAEADFNCNVTYPDDTAHTASSNESHGTGDTSSNVISIYVGSSPFRLLRTLHPSSSTNKELALKCFVFQQTCANFNVEQQCYKTKWNICRPRTDFGMTTNDGLQDFPDKSKRFALTWSQTKTPSAKKWSKDAQVYSCPFPGQIELSLPVVFTSSSTTVNAISTLLDSNIEAILVQRLEMAKRVPSRLTTKDESFSYI